MSQDTKHDKGFYDINHVIDVGIISEHSGLMLLVGSDDVSIKK